MTVHLKDHGTITLQGDAYDVAIGLCDQAVLGVAMHLDELHGPVEVLRFYAALFIYLGFHVQKFADADTARTMLQAALREVDAVEAGGGPPACFEPKPTH